MFVAGLIIVGFKKRAARRQLAVASANSGTQRQAIAPTDLITKQQATHKIISPVWASEKRPEGRYQIAKPRPVIFDDSPPGIVMINVGKDKNQPLFANPSTGVITTIDTPIFKTGAHPKAKQAIEFPPGFAFA